MLSQAPDFDSKRTHQSENMRPGKEAADMLVRVAVVEGVNLPPDNSGSVCAAVQLQLQVCGWRLSHVA